MQIDVQINAGTEFILPVDYNHIIQSAIYSLIDNDLAEFLHEQGYSAGERVFRLFCFSRLQGRFYLNKNTRQIIFTDNVQLIITSPIIEFIDSLANGLLQAGYWRIGRNQTEIRQITVKQQPVLEPNIVVKTISPVTMYSTMLRPDGRKYTVYFQPGDPDYDRMITANLQKKYTAYTGQAAPEGMVNVHGSSRQRMHLLQYKGTVIKGYMGTWHLTGPQELLQMAVDAGLGGKNSMGLGCVEMQKSR